jgi:hypothetical protein
MSARDGPHGAKSGVRRTHRGSSKRIRRIRWRDHTPADVLGAALITLAIILGVIVWMTACP